MYIYIVNNYNTLVREAAKRFFFSCPATKRWCRRGEGLATKKKELFFKLEKKNSQKNVATKPLWPGH